MKILLMDKEKNGTDPDDFTMMCRHISKSLSQKSSDHESPRLKIKSISENSFSKEKNYKGQHNVDNDAFNEKEITDKINLKFL